MSESESETSLPVDPVGASAVAATTFVGWLAAVTAAGGWNEPVIAVWAFLMFAFAGLVLYATGPGQE